MRRSILSSLVVIGAAVTVLLGAGTFGQFTASDTLSQSNAVTAGIMRLDLADVGPETGSASALSFDVASVCGNMTPQDECTTDVMVCNGVIDTTGDPEDWNCEPGGSNIDFEYDDDYPTATLTHNPSLPTDCEIGFTVDLDGTASSPLAPGLHDIFTLTIELDDDNDCMGISADVTFAANVTQVTTP